MSFGGRVDLADHDCCLSAVAFAGSTERGEKQLSVIYSLIVPLQSDKPRSWERLHRMANAWCGCITMHAAVTSVYICTMIFR